MALFHELNLLPVLLLLILWAVGGRLLAWRAFHLAPEEQPLVGLGLGMVLSTWLVNWTARLVPIGPATWIAAGITLSLGAAAAFLPLKHDRPRMRFEPGQWLAFFGLSLLFTMLGRGLAIFDDYQNLPFLSRIAAGDLPPHFPFSPGVRLGYHYFLLLLASQWMGAAQSLPWAALDLARGVSLALTVLLIGRLAFRLTGKPMAELAAVVFGGLAGGARWLMLFLPVSLAARLSQSIELIGSGAASGATLEQALASSWDLNGAGPVPFPFAFASGVYPPRIMAISGFGTAPLMVILLIALLGDRLRSRVAWPILMVLFASLALLNESAYLLLMAGVGGGIALKAVRQRSLRLPAQAWWWLATLAGSVAVAAVQGGLLTELSRGFLGTAAADPSYYDVRFRLVWPPAVVSSHLGTLSLLDPVQLLAAILEFGPVVLAFPLVVRHGLAAWREGRQAEAGLVIAGVLSLGMIFFQYSGVAGPTATSRLYGLFADTCLIYAVPLGWLLLERRRPSAQIVGALAALAAVMSGLVLLGIQFIAVPRPVASYFLDDLDAQMYRRHWDQLLAGSMVFDADPSRAVTIFGREVESQATLAGATEQYLALVEAPDPGRLHAAGFDFLYADREYWGKHQDLLSAVCVREVDEVVDILSATGEVGDFRRLMDLRACP